MPDHRSPLAKARDEWLESDEGRKCALGSASGQYLRNRLERSFIAGAEAQRRIASQNIAQKIEEILWRR